MAKNDKKTDLSSMDLESLKKELSNAEKQLFTLKMKHWTDELKQSHQITMMRRQIARIKTSISEKTLNQ